MSLLYVVSITSQDESDELPIEELLRPAASWEEATLIIAKDLIQTASDEYAEKVMNAWLDAHCRLGQFSVSVPDNGTNWIYSFLLA